MTSANTVGILGGDIVERRTILVRFSYNLPEIAMVIPVPFEVDTEEYIDRLFETVLDEKFKYRADWDFVDGISA